MRRGVYRSPAAATRPLRAGRWRELFLDEVGELPDETQIMLLRVLQSANSSVSVAAAHRVNVRVIAATNRDLQTAVANSNFRADLFYRLNVFPLEVPALRERGADIPVLSSISVIALPSGGQENPRSQQRNIHLLQSYDWPGNIRELQNVIERAVIIADSDTLAIDERWLCGRAAEAPSVVSPPASTLATQEKDVIEAALQGKQGPGVRTVRRGHTARRTGIDAGVERSSS